MARIRAIKPEWLNSRDMRRLSAGGVTVWWILISQADDEGRLHLDAEDVVQMARPWVKSQEIVEELGKMSRQHMIKRYKVDGEPYIAIQNWSVHQRVDHPRPSTLPPPPRDQKGPNSSRIPREGVAKTSREPREASREIREASRRSARAPADLPTRPTDLITAPLEVPPGGPLVDGLPTEEADVQAFIERWIRHAGQPSALDVQFFRRVPYEFDRLDRRAVLNEIERLADKFIGRSKPMPPANYLAGRFAKLQEEASEQGARPRRASSSGGMKRVGDLLQGGPS